MPLGSAFMAFVSAGQNVVSSIGPLSYASNAGLWLAAPIRAVDPDSALAAYMQGMSTAAYVNFCNASEGRKTEIVADMFRTTYINDEDQLDVPATYFTMEREPWEQVYLSRTTIPTDDECNTLYNRGLITPELYNLWMTRRYDGTPDFANTMQMLRFEIPGASDLVRFAVRDCFTPGIVQQYNYASETPLQIQPWMNAQGYGQPTGLTRPINATDQDGNPLPGDATWFDLYWWSHWELPSLTQGYEMVHRLYSSSRYGPSPDVTENTTFDPPDLELLQKTQDLPQYWRQRLQAISYHPLTRTDAESLFTLGIIQESTLYHALRADGYNDDNAMLLIEGTKLKQQRNLGINPGQVSKEWICENYKNGVITDDAAEKLLQDNGFDQFQAAQFLSVCQLEIKSKTAEEKIKHLRHAYMMGVYNTQQLKDLMIEMNVTPFVRNDLVDRWRMQRDIKIKFASSRQLLTFFVNGAIDEQSLTERLFNLGYESASITTMIYNSKIQITTRFAKALAQQAKAQAAYAKQQAALAQKIAKQQVAAAKAQQTIQEKQIQKRIKAIVRGATDANLKKWYSDGLISLWEVLYKLYYKDYTVTDAKRWVFELTPKPTETQYVAAQAKAQKQYLGEGNPPLVQ